MPPEWRLGSEYLHTSVSSKPLSPTFAPRGDWSPLGTGSRVLAWHPSPGEAVFSQVCRQPVPSLRLSGLPWRLPLVSSAPELPGEHPGQTFPTCAGPDSSPNPPSAQKERCPTPFFPQTQVSSSSQTPPLGRHAPSPPKARMSGLMATI